jgi:hypothetical protein
VGTWVYNILPLAPGVFSARANVFGIDTAGAARSRDGSAMTKRSWVLIVVAALLVTVGLAQRRGAAAINFDVGANGFSAYSIGGQDNPTLTLTRGQTYTFNVTAVGHPFWLVTAPGAAGVNEFAFTSGVTNNGAAPGVVTFVVPSSAPATMFYQCAFHDTMVGTIHVVPPASVPSLGPGAVALFAAALLVLGVALTRRRRTS